MKKVAKIPKGKGIIKLRDLVMEECPVKSGKKKKYKK
jgi:hypothetical protein